MRHEIRRIVAAVTSAGAIGSIVMVLLSVGTLLGGPAAAADGPQRPPTIEPRIVARASGAFALRPPLGARCEEDGTGSTGDVKPGPRTAADSWRWHGFIVEAGREISKLRFEPTGPGTDYDASDGSITAPLLGSSGEPLVQMLPAIRPEGLINPDQLAGIALDPTIFTLTPGDYTVGFACTDAGLELRQWWSTVVTIGAVGSPFLAAADPAAHESRADSGAGAEGSVGATTVEVDPRADVTGAVPVPAPSDAPEATPAPGVPSPTGTEARRGSEQPTGVSWSPLVALADVPSGTPIALWAVLAVVLARVAHLLVQPVRLVPAPGPMITRPVEVQRIPT